MCVEVIFDGALSLAGDKDEFIDARSPGLFYRIFDQRAVHHRQHFFWHGLGRGEEPGSESPTGKIALRTGFKMKSFLDGRRVDVQFSRLMAGPNNSTCGSSAGTASVASSLRTDTAVSGVPPS